MPDGLSGEEQAIYFSKVRGFFDSYACSRVMGRGKKMSDYIERQKVKDIRFSGGINHDGFLYVPYKELVDGIKELPSADVVQVVHGKWIDEDPAFAEYFANCSVCGYEIDVHNERGYFNFCPNCGAKMDEHGEG